MVVLHLLMQHKHEVLTANNIDVFKCFIKMLSYISPCVGRIVMLNYITVCFPGCIVEIIRTEH